MKEQEFDRLLSLEEEAVIDGFVHNQDGNIENNQPVNDGSLAKKLKHSLNRQINRKIFLGLILTFLGMGIFLFVLSFGFDQLFYDPTKPSPYIEDNNSENDYVYSDFHFLMDIYTGLNYPGKKYYQLEEKNSREGFGSYKMYAKIQDTYKMLHIDGTSNTKFAIKRNQFSIESTEEDSRLSVYVWDFYNDSKAREEIGYVKEMLDMDAERMEEIEKLPESAVLYAAISFKQSITLEETLNFMRQYPDSHFCWIGMDSEVQSTGGVYDGIRLDSVIYYSLTEEAEKQYPYLMLDHISEETTAEQLKQCYQSRLKIMADNPEFLKMVCHEQRYYGYFRRKADQIEDRFGEMNAKGLWAIGLYGEISKDDFLTMVEKGEITYANIKDVKISVLAK